MATTMSAHTPPGTARLTERPSSHPHFVLVFEVAANRLALDLEVVERVVPMVAVSALTGSPAAVLGVIDAAGQVVPVFDIRRRFGLAERAYGPDASLLLARSRRRAVAVAIDEPLGVREVGAAPFAAGEALPPGMEHVSGVVALDDGLVLIHDLETFLTEAEERLLAPALAEAGAEPA